jgi:hypothetical protein
MGIHWDRITSVEIKTIQLLTQELSDQILKKFHFLTGRRENKDLLKRE